MTPAPRKALRVSQLDVEDLDASFTKTIFETFNDCFKYTYILQPGSLTNLLAKSCLYGVVTYVTLVKSGQTVGQQILGLRYGQGTELLPLPRKKVKILHGCLVALFVGKSLQDSPHLLPSLNGDVKSFFRFLEVLVKTASILNFFVFLYKGKYQSFFLRLLGLQVVHTDSNPQQRGIYTEFITRDLVFSSLFEISSFLLSVINVDKIKRIVKKLQKRFENKPTKQCSIQNLHSCAICSKTPVMPHTSTNCNSCVYCYSCMYTLLSNDSDATCDLCDVTIGPEMLPLPVIKDQSKTS